MSRTWFALALAVAVGAAGCAAGQDPTVDPGPTAPGEASPTAVATVSHEPTGAAGQVQRVELAVEGGEVDGPGRVRVQLGREVELAVTSDVADHVHVHGYDIFQDVEAGETVRLTFTADLPGVFEVELEERGVHLVDLQVGG